jgi:serine/threonine protein kinase/Tfp pilus assembly protein PilF
MLGSVVSHYRILEKIGEGGMGVVFLAEDLKLRRRVAIKFLSPELTRDPDRKQRFLQEARAAAAIEHPHVAAVHDVDEAEGRTFIVMEFVQGESLRRSILEGSLTPERAVDLILQVADGLGLAHARGIVHRDLKPENVLVADRGYAKIIDFGLAKLVEPALASGGPESQTLLRTREGVAMGTVDYMSPEQARGEAVDARSDLFSLGVMLHEMISGESPFRRGTAIETLNAILNENPKPPLSDGASLPPGLSRILLKAMAKDPKARHQSVAELASELREVRDAVAKPAPRHRRRIWAFAAALVVTALAGVFALRDGRPPPGIGASGRPAIAALQFDNQSDDESLAWLSQGLPGMLLTGLAQTPGLDVISSRRIEEVAPGLDSESPARMAEAARRAGAGAVVTGAIYKAGAELRLDVRIEDLESGRLLAAESVRGTDVFELADELTARVRESLRVADRAAGRPIREVTTDSLEAYRLYGAGVEARHNIRHADARRLLEEAVAIDPSFAMAHFHLSAIATALGETALRDEHRRKTMENLRRMPQKEALLVRAFDAMLGGRLEESSSLLENLLALYPGEEEAYDTYVHVRDRMGQQDKVLEILDRWAKAIPGPGSGHFHNHRGYAFMQVGRYQDAASAFSDYARVRPAEANPYDSLGELRLVTGEPERALESYRRALSLNPEFTFSVMGRVWANGMLGRYDDALAELSRLEELGDTGFSQLDRHFLHALVLSRVGRLREAQSQIRDATASSARARNPEARAALYLLSAWIHVEAGENALALEAVGRAAVTSPDPARSLGSRDLEFLAHLFAGVAQTRSGRIDAAKDHLSAMGTPTSPTETWYRHALSGEIALAEANPAAAEREYSAGEPERKMWFNFNRLVLTAFANGLPFRDGLARAAEARGDLPGAIQIYQKLATPDVESRWTAVLEPRFVLQAARLLDRSGQKEASLRGYRKFLDLWKDADPELPELREARAALGR